jgi:hypothetical protein
MKFNLIQLNLLLVPLLIGSLHQQASAVTLTSNTVNWAVDNIQDAAGTGSVSNANFVYTANYTTSNIGNSGTSFSQDWSTIPAINNTAALVGFGTGSNTAGVLGTIANIGNNEQKIGFSSSYFTSAILLFNYLDAGTTFDFGPNVTVSLFNGSAGVTQGVGADSNKITVGAGSDGVNDAFAVQLTGSLGTFITFNTSSNTTSGTIGFTVEAVPEPASMIGLLMGLSPFGIGLYNKRKQLQKIS